MIRNIGLIFLAGIIIIISYSCNKDFEDDAQYKRPDWLAGMLYNQLEAQPELSTFTYCIKRTGLDAIINISGCYTVFAPDNNAFSLYFQTHPEYKSVEDIPLDELTRIVKIHIIQDPWSVELLRKLDVNGWIDTTDENNNKPKGFKRETLLRDNDLKYGVLNGVLNNERNNLRIVDTLKSAWYRKHAIDGNKYASVFYKEYLDIYNLKSSDYQFYFNRPFENPGDMYYMDGRILNGNIFAENGFIHIIDRVIEPIQNVYEILNSKTGPDSYSNFLDLINNFPSFTYNNEKTNAQPGARQGLIVDSLFDITYPSLTFSIINERTKAPSGTTGLADNVASIRYHNGLIAPTNAALDAFVNEYLVGYEKWGSLNKAPAFIRKMIANSYMCNTPIFPTNFKKGFLNGEKDYVILDESTIVKNSPQFGSNSSFIGVKQAIVPRAFSSVAGPIYLSSKYKNIMYAVEVAGLLPTLKAANNNYSFFIESDANCAYDSSLIFSTIISQGIESFSFTAIQKQGSNHTKFPLNVTDLRILLLNHIGTDVPRGTANKEFIQNLTGNYIIVDNVNKFISGTSPTKIGYNGNVPINVILNDPIKNADNGKTYDISNWFSFSAPILFLKISTTPELSKFHLLLKKAGYNNTTLSKYTFLSDNEFYTVFAPTNTAFANYNADTMSIPRLQKFLRMHFVQGTMMFTDGKKSANYYETTRIDEKSTPYTTLLTKIYVEPGRDVINIKDKLGNNYLTVNESPVANMITGRLISTGNPPFPESVSTAVIHEIDKVLLFDDLDTK